MQPAILRTAVTLALAVALGAGFLAAPSASAADPSVHIGSFTTEVGLGGAVELEAGKIGPPGLSAWTVDVIYDPSIVTVGDCTAEHGGICNTDFAEDTIRVTGISVLGLQGDVLLATIAFDCKAEGESALELDVSVLADSTPGNPTPIDHTVAHGKVTCTKEVEPKPDPTPTPAPPPGSIPDDPKLPGDANCDGAVDAIDAALVLQLAAGLLSGVPCEGNADTNGNGSTNAVDAALILQEAAGLK